MELKSSKTFKKLIDCLPEYSGDTVLNKQQVRQWRISDLAARPLETDHFNLYGDSELHSYEDVLCWCVNILAASPSARLMLRESMEREWSIAIEDLNGGEYCIDVERKVLLLDNNALVPSSLGRSSYFRNITLVTLSKALRDIWQEKRHGGLDEVYRAEYLMMLERVRAADCDVLAVLVAWELRSAEYPEMWRHLIGSENGDMAMIFSGYLERKPASHFNGNALAQAFKQWFKSQERVRQCDHDTLEYMDDILACSQEHNPFGKKKPAKMNIEILSCLPDKTAYLQGLGAEIISDPLYSGMDDPINQTHLFHILYDLEATIINEVPFRSADLARKIFPEEFV